MNIRLTFSCRILAITMLFFGLCLSTVSVQASKTFFSHRSMQSDINIFQSISDAFINRTAPSKRFDFSGTVFYQESTNHKDLAQYFLPGGKTEITISGINAPGVPDISATWLQIAGANDGEAPLFATDPDPLFEELYFNKFQSKIRIRPEFKRFGTVLRAFKSFTWCNHALWVDVTLPFIQVQTDLNLKEFDIQNAKITRSDITPFQITEPGPVVTRREVATLCNMLNVQEALNNPSWKYGKFKKGAQKLAGLADITVKLGYAPVKEKCTTWNIYSNFIIPTGYKPTSENVFEPLVGNGQHFGLGLGTSIDYEIFSNSCYQVCCSSNVEYSYLFRNTQVRSFDLAPNGEWSRYLLVFTPTGDPSVGVNATVTPGINVFSQPMHVTPQSEINWTSVFNFKNDSWSVYAGYNLWWKQKEKVRLANAWNKQVAIMHFSPDEANPFDLPSFSKATIKDHYLGTPAGNIAAGADANIILVKKEDLNINSAAHPSVIGHKMYGAVGYTLQWACQPIEFSFGGSYQINDSVNTVQDWSTWLQVNLPI